MPAKFKTLAGALYLGAWAAFIGLPILALVFSSTTEPLSFVDTDYLAIPEAGVSQVYGWLLLFIAALPGMAMLYTLWQMIGLFDGFRRGRVITPNAAQRMARLGYGLVLISALTILAVPLQSALLSTVAPVGEREVSLIIGGEDIWFLIAGGLMVLIGYALAEAVRLSDENKGFI